MTQLLQQKLKPQKLSDIILAQLEELIVEGSLQPGEKLLPERDLAKKFDVSRPSLREAIQKLEIKYFCPLQKKFIFSSYHATLRKWVDLVSLILLALEVLCYHVYLSDAYSNHNEHFQNGHLRLSRGCILRKLRMLVLQILFLLDIP